VDDLGIAGLAASGAGATVEAVGGDINGITPRGVFTALYDLQKALVEGSPQDILVAGEQIEGMIALVNHSLGEVGTRAKAMTDRLMRTEEAVDATRVALSKVRDLDYSVAITRFQQAQMALQANLMSGSKSMSLSLMDFIR
jgi:flagellin-like hook-associated protein FlgL